MASSAADLGSSDLRSALGFAADLADCADAATLEEQVHRLPRIVGADTIIVGSVHKPRPGSREPARLVASDDPPGFFDEEAREAFGRLWRQQPVVVHHFGGFVAGASKLSDFLSEREWRRSEVYNDCYGRRLGLAWEISAQINCTAAELSCAALQRADHDFSERDRSLLETIAPHLRAAYARVEAMADRRRRLELLERGFEHSGEGFVLVDRAGGIVAAGPRAKDDLRDWFGEATTRGSLPPEVEAWRRRERGSPGPVALERRRAPRVLLLRLIAGEPEDAILVAERSTEAVDPEQLRRRLPISRREAQVLALIASGMMNAAIAHQLGVSVHTVNRHVEHVYAKLGVHNRAAATAAALAVSTRPEQDPAGATDDRA